MTPAIARPTNDLFGFRSDQSGIALIQVLFISAIISMLAIRFSQTARDQIEIAQQFDDRINAQLMAYSAANEVVFLQLSDTVNSVSRESFTTAVRLPKRSSINLYGEAMQWGDGITVSVQDLGGLLPQIYPNHFLWRRLLRRRAFLELDVDRYIGTWSDMQDRDTRAWLLGDDEPSHLPTGEPYLNAFAQNDMVPRWVFFDRPDLIKDIARFSHIYATEEVNLNYSPRRLLDALFDLNVAEEIARQREISPLSKVAMRSLMPAEFDGQPIVTLGSGRLLIDVLATVNDAVWREQKVFSLNPTGTPPAEVMLKN